MNEDKPSSETTNGVPTVGNDMVSSTEPTVPAEPGASESAPMSEPMSGQSVQTPPSDQAGMPSLSSESDQPPADAPNPAAETPAGAEAAPSAAAAVPRKHSSLPIILIVLLVILALAAASYFAFVKKDKTPADSSVKTTSTSATQTATPDTASSAIDTSLSSIDETKDYDAASLNDTTLGL